MAQVGDKRYSNWVKDTLSLLYVKEGIEVFIDSQSTTFHAQLKTTLGTSICTCSSPGLGRGKKGWVVKQCYGLCQAWLNRILSHHRLKPPSIPNIFPGNLNAQLWHTDSWEVMKCFQPQGCQDQHSASDADMAALLDLMRNCDHFFQFNNPSNNIINEVMSVRNRLMHSSNFLVEDSGLADDVQTMLTFLRSLTSLSTTESQPVQAAIDNITQLDGKTLDLSLNREIELKAIKASQIALQAAMKNLKQTVKYDVDTKVQGFQGSIDTKVQGLQGNLDAKVQGLQDTIDTKVQGIQDTIDTKVQGLQGTMDTNVQGLQDTIDTKVQDLRGNMDTKVQGLQGNLDAKVQGLQDTIDTKVQGIQDTIDTKVQGLQNSIDTSIQGLQGTMDTKVQDIQGTMDTNVQGLQDTIDTKVQGLQDTMDTNVQGLQGNLDANVQGLQANVDAKVQGIQDKMDTKVQGIQDTMDTKVQGLQINMDTKVHCLQDNVDTKIQGLQDNVETKVQGLQDNMDTNVQGLQHQLGTEVSGLHNKVDREIQGIQQRLAAHTSRIQDLQKELTTQHETTGNTMLSLTQLQLQLDLLAKDLKQVKDKQASFTAINQSQPINPSGIQDRLIGLYSQTFQKIPIYPLQPELTQHVASLFVLPSMKLTNPRGISEHHMMGADEGSESVVTRLQDIFAPAGSRCTDIYIMGDAGTGKSTLCEYLVHLWVSCHTSSNQAPDTEATIMNQFDLLFYISLREATSYNVDDMIKNQLQLEDVSVASLLYNHSSLIILDGLDEYSLKKPSRSRLSSENLPARRYSNKCTVLTTSRPWKIELLRKELDDKVERLIAIVGLDTESQKKLVGNVVDLLSAEMNPVKTPADFIKEVETQKLDKFMKTPIVLMQMLGLWLSGEPLGGSKCSIYAKLIDKQIQFTEEVRGYPTDLQLQRAASDIGQVQLDDDRTCSYQHQFSIFFKSYTHIMNNKTLLLKLCRFAYRSLSSEDKTHSLVFNHDQMELFDMSHEEIRQCLHLGILTQYKVFGQITQRLKYISFIHKSHHEFFAAIYLAQIDQAELQPLLEHDFTSLGHILEMGTVFMFVCGISPKVACNISRFIMDKASGDARLEQYQQVSRDWLTADPITDLVKQLQSLILVGIEEGRQNGHEITDMQLHNLYMDATNTEFPPARVLACTGSLDLTQVKSLYIQDKGVISSTVLQELLKQTSKGLHKLVLWDTVVSVKMIQSIVQQQQGRLQTLGLVNNTVDNVDVSHLNQTDLQVILSAPTKSLSLEGLVLTHSQLEFLCQHMSNSSYGEVCLGKLQCTTHEYKAYECNQRLDLSANRNLSRLQLVQLPVQEVLFVPENLARCMIGYLPEPVMTSMISCLKRAEKLEMLHCTGSRGSTVDELAATLPHLQQLQHLALADINLSEQQRVVRAVAKLKKLELIQLCKVTMREEELREMLSALTSSHRVGVVLGYSGSAPVTITGYNRHTNLLEQIRRDPNTHVYRDEVKIEGDTCIVKQFYFYTKM